MENIKKTCKYLNYLKHLLILVSTFTDYVSIFAFASLVAIPVGVTSSALGIKICTITARIKKYMPIKKMKKKHEEILLSKASIDSYISHDKFVSVNSVLREYNEMKFMWNILYKKAMEAYCEGCQKHAADENPSVRKTKQNKLMLLSNCVVCGK